MLSLTYPRNLFPENVDWFKLKDTVNLTRSTINKQYCSLHCEYKKRLKTPPRHVFQDYPINGRVKSDSNWMINQKWYRPEKDDWLVGQTGEIKGYLWEYNRWNLLILWNFQKYGLCCIHQIESLVLLDSEPTKINKTSYLKNSYEMQQKYKTHMSAEDVTLIKNAIKYRHYRKIWQGDNRRAMDILWYEEKLQKRQQQQQQQQLSLSQNNDNNNNDKEGEREEEEEEGNQNHHTTLVPYNQIKILDSLILPDDANYKECTIRLESNGIYVFVPPPKLNVINENEKENYNETNTNTFSFVFRSPFKLNFEYDSNIPLF
jgi:hypothetical protein